MERNPAMKLQYHKIRGVDKSVCTAEQKIAYNMASRIYGDIRFAKAWQQYDSGKVPAFLQNDWESKADRKAYIENEHICPMIRKRRYPIHNNTVC